jgi:hypothetical protein
LVADDGASILAALRVVDGDGNIIAGQDRSHGTMTAWRGIEDWSYLKFPYYKPGYAKDTVGPLLRESLRSSTRR